MYYILTEDTQIQRDKLKLIASGGYRETIYKDKPILYFIFNSNSKKKLHIVSELTEKGLSPNSILHILPYTGLLLQH